MNPDGAQMRRLESSLMSHAHAVSPSPIDDDLLLIERDLLRFFKIKSLRTVRRWVAEERLPAHLRLGSKKYWRRSVLMDFIACNESATGHVTPKRSRRSR
jgi:hypothetical protein